MSFLNEEEQKVLSNFFFTLHLFLFPFHSLVHSFVEITISDNFFNRIYVVRVHRGYVYYCCYHVSEKY